MKVRSHTTLVGVFPVISHTGAAAQGALGLRMTEFVGKFNLPFDAAWGEMVLPQGDYALCYGALGDGLHCVEILGAGRGVPRGIFLVREQNAASVVQNALVCTCRGGRHVIRTLELPAVGRAVSFVGPTAGKFRKSRSGRTSTYLAEEPVQLRVPS